MKNDNLVQPEGTDNNKIKMVVFDWAGTTVDYGSRAPMEVFKRVFEQKGINLTDSEINGPMGMEKRAHIRALLSLETADRQWKELYKRDWSDEDVDELYEGFEEILYDVVADYSMPVDGAVEAVEQLRKQGVRIGSTTGYNNHIMTRVSPVAEEHGYIPDCIVTPDITGEGRPAPYMLNECMRLLKVYPSKLVVKVGDTVADIYEGKNAGAWSIGILEGSNLLGFSKKEYEELSLNEKEQHKAEATAKYKEAGADMVINDISELPASIERINKLLENE